MLVARTLNIILKIQNKLWNAFTPSGTDVGGARQYSFEFVFPTNKDRPNVRMYVCMYVCMYVSMYVHVCIRMYVCNPAGSGLELFCCNLLHVVRGD